MCGRFTQAYTWRKICDFLGVIWSAQNLRARYSIVPTMDVDAVVARGGDRVLTQLRWASALTVGSVEGFAGDVQRTSGDSGGEADVPIGVPAYALHRAGLKVL